MGSESKWGQIKIQENPLFAARNALTKFCSDPSRCLRRTRPSPRPASPAQPSVTRTAQPHPHSPRSARLRVGRLENHLLTKQ